MIRAAVLAAAVLAVPGAAAAVPPPPPVAVVVISPDRAPPGLIDASEALLASLPEAGHLALAPSPLTSADFPACAEEGAEPEACARAVLSGRAAERPPLVAVLVSPGPGFSVGWTCVGVGEAMRQPERQRVGIDLMSWRAGGAFSPEAQAAAAWCVTAAASESGW